MKKKKLIPFSWLPASWGLSGTTRAIAEIEYYYDPGYEKDMALIPHIAMQQNPANPNIIEQQMALDVKLKYGKIAQRQHDYDSVFLHNTDTGKFDMERTIAKLDLKYGVINQDELDFRLRELDAQEGGNQLSADILDLERKFRRGEISENEFQKQVATLKDEPYVNVIHVDLDTENPARGVMELDFNKQFVDYLRGHGMTGDDDQVVNNWFNAVCNTVVRQAEQDKDFGLERVDD